MKNFFIFSLVLGLLIGCGELAQKVVEDPGIEIVKKSSCGFGNATMEDYCNEVAGVNGQVKWSGVKASTIPEENWKPMKNPYKNNPDVSLVVIEMKKVTKKGNEKTAVLGYAVNTKSKVKELIQLEIDGKPQSILLGLMELGIMSME
jgi:hypothetical protein